MSCLNFLICFLVAYNVNAQDCGCFSTLPLPLKNLYQNVPNTTPVTNLGIAAPSCGCISSAIKQCGCPDPNCGCYGLIQAPIVPSGYNAAIGLPNPIIGVQSCGCNTFGACACGTPVVGNICGRTTPQIGLATACGCSDPTVRILDGCTSCQPVYSYNLPSLGVPTCSCTSLNLPGCGCGVSVPSYLPSIGLPGYGLGACGCSSFAPIPCGCTGSCTCKNCGLPINSCNCKGPCGCPLNTCTCKGPCGCPVNACTCNSPCGCPFNSCTCNSPCSNINSCGCIEVPCGPPQYKTTCTCVTPTIETPCGCAQGQPTCACTTTLEVPTCEIPVCPPFAPVIGCSRYLRQVVVQPPFM